ncbi:hypothetical protein M0811_10432 [Anaeramoeba ignava]|uniref:PAS domain-containing protein n=1 Tax=Anaeramoeba ignava TaxID=1746090 RepID=A0A9Q0LGE5_ANAIG|nr:hypothetical protein M0811_10432 [Anaeramoeba ignava]
MGVPSSKFISRKMEDFYRKAIQNTAEPILILNQKGSLIEFNRSILNILGFTQPNELLEHSLIDFCPLFQERMGVLSPHAIALLIGSLIENSQKSQNVLFSRFPFQLKDSHNEVVSVEICGSVFIVKKQYYIMFSITPTTHKMTKKPFHPNSLTFSTSSSVITESGDFSSLEELSFEIDKTSIIQPEFFIPNKNTQIQKFNKNIQQQTISSKLKKIITIKTDSKTQKILQTQIQEMEEFFSKNFVRKQTALKYYISKLIQQKNSFRSDVIQFDSILIQKLKEWKKLKLENRKEIFEKLKLKDIVDSTSKFLPLQIDTNFSWIENFENLEFIDSKIY